MAKTISLSLNGQVFQAELGAKVKKSDLYGYAKTMREKDGKTLMRGLLCPDGRLLPSGSFSLAKVDPLGTPLEEPVTYIADQPAEKLPGSFERENPLYPVPIKELVGFCVRDCYPLANLVLGEGLYRTSFAYRQTYQYQDGYVLVKPGETWLLVGVRKQSVLVGQAIVYEFFDAEGSDDSEDDEELDFGMV
jgi:hypothetical protein